MARIANGAAADGAGAPQAGGRGGKFIAVANMKGGVGKTTTVVSLAETLAADDPLAKVLVIDLDPQASASVCIAGDALLWQLITGERTLEAFLEARLIHQTKTDIRNSICSQLSPPSHGGSPLDLSLLPCGPELRIVERELLYELTNRDLSMNAIDGKIWLLFDKEVRPLAKDYDFILFDCAPGISPVTEAAICLADLVVVPTIPDYLSVYGLDAFHGSIWASRSGRARKPKSAPHILLTRTQQITHHHSMRQQVVAATQRPGSPYRILKTSVPQSAGLTGALVEAGETTYTRKYTARIVDETLMPLAREIKGLL